ncbi:MAG TPA: hypothetical protein VFV73_13050 [Streptosporangiaceae bacterium]|nr:hypothetical protein [Streptosporangiaceae bacterium]
MAADQEVSRGTIRRAFAALRADGVIASRRGARRVVVGGPRVQSFGEVFRRILDDDAAAAKANEAFEDHYGAAVGRGQIAAMPSASWPWPATPAATWSAGCGPTPGWWPGC